MCAGVCVWLSVLKSQFTTLGVYHTKAKAGAARCNRRIMQRNRKQRAEAAATEIEIVLALDLMKDFYHANSWQRCGGVAGNCCHFYGSH